MAAFIRATAVYTCGLYAWAGNRQADGGFYRVRATGKASWLPIGLHARTNGMEIQFSDELDPGAANDPKNYAMKVWSLKRTAEYGSKHIDEHSLKVAEATLAADRKSVFLKVPELKPTWCMEIKCDLRGADGTVFTRTVHNTIHSQTSSSNREIR